MYDVAKYSTRISYSAEDEGYIATVPELPGCSAFGESAAEALGELTPAIEAWISAAQEAGNPIPAPAAIDEELPSGKFLVRIARTVHAQLSTAAQREGISLNQYVSTFLATATLGDVYAYAYTQASTASQLLSHHGGPVTNLGVQQAGIGVRRGSAATYAMHTSLAGSPLIVATRTTDFYEPSYWSNEVTVVGTAATGKIVVGNEGMGFTGARSKGRARASSNG